MPPQGGDRVNDSTPDLAAVTQIQQQIWSKGDSPMVASLVNKVQRLPCRGARHRPDERVLDARGAQRRDLGGATQLGRTARRTRRRARPADRGRQRAVASGWMSSSSRPTPRTFPSR